MKCLCLHSTAHTMCMWEIKFLKINIMADVETTLKGMFFVYYCRLQKKNLTEVSKTKLDFKHSNLAFTLNVILRRIPVLATINTVFERGEKMYDFFFLFEKKRGKSDVLKGKNDLQVNPLWGVLFNLGFVLHCTVVVIRPPARLHLTANGGARPVTRGAHLVKRRKPRNFILAKNREGNLAPAEVNICDQLEGQWSGD